MFFGDFLELGTSGHGAVVVHDFADDGCGPLAGGSDEVDGAFGVSGSDEYAAFLVAEGEDVSGLDEVFGCGFGFGEESDGVCAVGGRDAGCDAVCGVDGDGHGGGVWRRVVSDHHGHAEPVEVVPFHGDADQTASVEPP